MILPSRIFWLFLCAVGIAFSAPLPDLPGTEISEAERVMERSQSLVEPTKKPPSASLHHSWTAPGIEEQLSQDETLIGMGMGAIFVPKMSESRLEPEILVTDANGERSWIGHTGLRIVVPQGVYTVRIGSGTFKQQSVYRAEVLEGQTTLVDPQWGGLVISTLSSEGDLISEDYEIYSVADGESYGRGYGQTQERLNDIKTWILPPGIYRISRRGEDYGSLVNYITVQTNPGELTFVELVFETGDGLAGSGNLIAGGVRPLRTRQMGDTYWNFNLRVGGTASYTTVMTASGKQDDVWNTITDLRLRARYDRFRWFGLYELYGRTNLQWNDKQDQPAELTVVQDFLQFQNAWVYRLRSWVGPYARVNLKTHVWPEYYKMGSNDTLISVVDRSNDTTNSYTSGEIRVKPSFFPLRIGEGTGLNLQIFSTNALELSAQTGLACRQTYLNGVLQPINKDQTLYGPADDVKEFGWENSVTARIRPWRVLTLDLVGEVFFPNARFSRYQVEELTADLRLALTRFLEISYQQQLLDRDANGLADAEGGPRFQSVNTVQLRLYLNF